jgi:hypothetical protein
MGQDAVDGIEKVIAKNIEDQINPASVLLVIGE